MKTLDAIEVRCPGCSRTRWTSAANAKNAGTGRNCRSCAQARPKGPRGARATIASLIPAGDLTRPINPLAPTGARPGSEAKIRILQARVVLHDAGELLGSVFLPGDYSLVDERGAA